MLQFKNQNPARGRSVSPASPARAGEGDRVSGGGGAMNASCNPSIASEMNARHKRPHRLALFATSPVATGEAKIGEPRKGTETTSARTLLSCVRCIFKNQNLARGRSIPPASPARAGERSTSSNHTSLTLVFLGRFPIRPVTQSAAPEGLLLGQVSRGTA